MKCRKGFPESLSPHKSSLAEVATSAVNKNHLVLLVPFSRPQFVKGTIFPKYVYVC